METSPVKTHSTTNDAIPEAVKVDVVVVGAGFSGMYLLYKLRNMGLNVKTFEAGDNVGGTWYWNRYPGARCDNESIEYSYSFSKELENEWTWTEKYATQPEILKYINHVADRFDLRKDIQFNTKVTSAIYNDLNGRWEVSTDKGDCLSAQFCIMATGPLSSWNMPNFKGMESFRGMMYHTGNWPKEGVDFTGKRVGVIGTGSSGIQSIPLIAEQAEKLYVFQRTPNFSIPARNAMLTESQVKEVKENYAEIRELARHGPFGSRTRFNSNPASHYTPEEQQEVMEKAWKISGLLLLGVFSDTMSNPEANDIVANFVKNKIRETVKDPHVAEMLIPKDLFFGSKRICIDSDYWETFNRENVTLVDVKATPIEEIDPQGLKTADGQLFDLDCIVFATGFDALTGTLGKIDIRGKEGLKLKEKWSEGPKSFLGLISAGFPNMFIVGGPGSPSVLSNMMTSIEQHVDWITECIDHMRKQGLMHIDTTTQAETDWAAIVNMKANLTLYVKADSWYMGSNIPGKPRGFLLYAGGVGDYRSKCEEVTRNGYEGFVLTN